MLLTVSLGTLAVALIAWLVTRNLSYGSFYPGEITYRLFLSFYGLLFPAYVWLVMVPPRTRPAASYTTLLRVTALVILIAAPMFWLGFIQNRMVWLLPAVALVLLAKAFTSRHV